MKNRHKSKAAVIEYSKRAPECASAPSSMVAARRKLPAWEAREKVVDLVARHDVVLVAGETGCGKSTQVPQFLFDASGCEANIACSQPETIVRDRGRGARVAAERGENCGQTVGYQVRFESSFSAKTRFLFATPGVLLRKLGSDPDFVSYTHFLLDEVHEEDRDTEFLLVALRELVARRREAYDASPDSAAPVKASADVRHAGPAEARRLLRRVPVVLHGRHELSGHDVLFRRCAEADEVSLGVRGPSHTRAGVGDAARRWRDGAAAPRNAEITQVRHAGSGHEF